MSEAAKEHRVRMLEANSKGDLRMALLEAHRCLCGLIRAFMVDFDVPEGRKSETDFRDDLSEDIPSLWMKIEQKLPEGEIQRCRELFGDSAFLNRILAASRLPLESGIRPFGRLGETPDGRLQGIMQAIVDQVEDISAMLLQLRDRTQAEKNHNQQT